VRFRGNLIDDLATKGQSNTDFRAKAQVAVVVALSVAKSMAPAVKAESGNHHDIGSEVLGHPQARGFANAPGVDFEFWILIKKDTSKLVALQHPRCVDFFALDLELLNQAKGVHFTAKREVDHPGLEVWPVHPWAHPIQDGAFF